jgi:protein-disulfide isomerase
MNITKAIDLFKKSAAHFAVIALLLFPFFVSAAITPDMITIISPSLLGNSSPKEIAELKQSIITRETEIFETQDLLKIEHPVLVEFFDYTCGHCKQMAKRLSSFTAKHPNIQIIYKEFPIRGDQARYAARAAIASKQQNQYVGYHRALMYYNDLTNSAVIHQAEKLKLDIKQLKRDMESKETYQIISNNYALAKALKISGTPTFVIYGIDLNKKPHIYYVQGSLERTELKRFLYGIIPQK